MRVKVRNNSQGPFGVEKAGGGYVFVGSGKTREIDAASPGRLYELDFLDVEAIDAEVPDMPESLASKVRGDAALPILEVDEALSAEVVDPFDHDADGKPGGSRKGRASTASKGARRRRKAASK